MRNILNEIIEQKQIEVQLLKSKAELSRGGEKIKLGSSQKSFKAALQTAPLSIIGEIKRKSPSKGDFAVIAEPSALLEDYIEGGVSAISVLTDEKFFGGSIKDLEDISHQLQHSNIPVLRKDFIIDRLQIIESISAGANAILLIVSVLKEKTVGLLQSARELGIDAIVEVHDKDELAIALAAGADIIAVNNRNLSTFAEDIHICLKLIDAIPNNIVTIAASAITTADDLKAIHAAGFNAVLMGEALVRSAEPAALLQQLRAAL